MSCPRQHEQPLQSRSNPLEPRSNLGLDTLENKRKAMRTKLLIVSRGGKITAFQLRTRKNYYMQAYLLSI